MGRGLTGTFGEIALPLPPTRKNSEYSKVFAEAGILVQAQEKKHLNLFILCTQRKAEAIIFSLKLPSPAGADCFKYRQG